MSNTIAANRRARHDYFIEQEYNPGIALEGWEVKSLRAGRVQLNDGYVLIKNNEAWLMGAHISPLATASTHVKADPIRSRKLLFMRRELDKLLISIQQQGYTLVALQLYWKGNFIKLRCGLAKGKKLHDKRATIKERDWKLEKLRLARLNRP